jgi:hypothetical protein
MNKTEVFDYIVFVLALILLSMVLPVSNIILATYYQNTTYLCGISTTSVSGCGSGLSTTYCSSDKYYPSQSCSQSPAFSVCQSATSSVSCGGNKICGMCSGTGDTCGTATCGLTYGCTAGNVCNGQGSGSSSYCVAKGGTGTTCYCNTMCTTSCCGTSCSGSGTCQPYIGPGLSYCGYYNGTNSGCNSYTATTFCTSSQYFPAFLCTTSPAYTACQPADRTHSCGSGMTVCGKCSGTSDTCGTAECGGTYGCSGTNICDGVSTGASHCIAPFSKALAASCLCDQVCASGLCSGGICQTYRGSTPNLCGYYNGTSGICTNNAVTYCPSATYYPSQSCTLGTSALSCSSQSASASCAVCGNCSGSGDTCNAVACGTTNSYGCGAGLYCGGTLNNCQSPFNVGAACNCTAQCASPSICTNSACAYSVFFNVTWNYPANNTWNSTTQNIVHYYTPIWNNAVMANCTLWTNGTGSFAYKAANATSLTNNTVNSITYNYAADTAWMGAYINCTNTTGTSNTSGNYIIKIDITAPSQVLNLINSSTGGSWVNISWDASTDATSGIQKYLVWRDSVNIVNTTSTTLYYNDTGLTPGTSYSYVVGAMDNAGNYGQNSSSLTVAPLVTATQLSQSASPVSPSISGTTVTFSCNYSLATDGSPVTGATVYLNLTGLNFSTIYSGGNYTYSNSSMTSGSNSWNCIASKTGYASQTGALQSYTISVPTLTTDTSNYSNCGSVFYRLHLYDANYQLVNSYFSITFLYPNSTTASSLTSLYPNNGTGVYTGSYLLNSSSPVGTWLLKVIDISGLTAGKNFAVATSVCGDGVCSTPTENFVNCPQDCLYSFCGDGYCDYSKEDCNNCTADCSCSGSSPDCCDCGSLCGYPGIYDCTPIGHCTALQCGCS